MIGMGRRTSLSEEEQRLIVETYKDCNDLVELSQKTNLPYNRIYLFIKSLEKKAKQVINKNDELATQVVKQSFDAYNSLLDKIDQIENFIEKMKDEEGNIKPAFSKDYLMAWNGVTETYKWYIDRKIKMKDMMEAEIFRDAILEAIKNEYPGVAAKIKNIIDRKRKELGIL